MKKYKRILVTMFFVLFITTNAFASTIYIGTFPGNDPSSPSANLEGLERDVSSWLTYDITLEFYAKVDAPSATITEGTGGLSLTYDTDTGENKSGTWLTGDDINLFSVKAGNGYALYWLDPAATSGTWDTTQRGNKGISHLSTWRVVSDDPPNVQQNPEPSTMLLFGFGLLGLARGGRKKQ